MYQFSKLSPNEFETLAVDIVGKMNNIFFQRFTEGPDGGIDGFYESSDNNWIVQAKRYKNTTTLMSKMQQEKEKMDNYIPKRYFLVTSCSLTPANKEKIKLIMTPYILSTNDILGEDELISLVKEYPEILKNHYKLWLGSVHELNFITNNEFYNRSSSVLSLLLDDLQFFVLNHDLEKIDYKLKTEHYLFISGDPGSGKTISASHLAVKYYFSEPSYEFQWISDRKLNDAIQLIQKGINQVIVIDDFLGATFLSSDNLLSVANDLKVLINIAQKSDGKLKIIFTSRDYILSQMLVQIDDSILKEQITKNSYTINLFDSIFRANIVYSYYINTNLSTLQKQEFINKKVYQTIIQHDNFNPRLLKNIFMELNNSDNLVSQFCIEKLDNPSSIWKNAFSKLSKEAQVTLYTLSLVENYISIENLTNQFNEFYYKIYGTVSNNFLFDNALDELEPNFIISKTKAETTWFIITNGGVRDFILKSISTNKILISIILDSLHYFDFGIEVFSLFVNDNKPIKINEEQQIVLLKKLVYFLEAPIDKLSVSVVFDENGNQRWTNRKNELGSCISQICQRLENEEEMLELLAFEISKKYKQDRKKWEEIIYKGHLPTLFIFFRYFDTQLRTLVYDIATKQCINSEDAAAIAQEYIKNKEFKKIVDTNRRRIVKMLEDTCFNEVERAKDENHIQAIVNDIYQIEDVFKEFKSLKYLYYEKYEKMYYGDLYDEFDINFEIGYWENNINQKDKESFLEDLKFKKIDIDKIFKEVSLETK